jgi:hypothetical protein
VIAEILVENSRGVFGGQVGEDDIYECNGLSVVGEESGAGSREFRGVLF